jgi:hypothetical protein
VRYAAKHWYGHLMAVMGSCEDVEELLDSLEVFCSKHLLHWLELLSLLNELQRLQRDLLPVVVRMKVRPFARAWIGG